MAKTMLNYFEDELLIAAMAIPIFHAEKYSQSNALFIYTEDCSCWGVCALGGIPFQFPNFDNRTEDGVAWLYREHFTDSEFGC